MKSDLEELIVACEIERAELEKQISEYVSEGDYLYAHHHQKGLRKLNGMLNVLKGLQNPLYKSITEEERRISNIKKVMDRVRLMGVSSFWESMIKESETRILNLKREAVKPGYDSQEVDDALFSLANGTVKGFKLYFKTSPDVFVSFKLADYTIEVRLQYDAAAYEQYGHIFRTTNQFKNLGFQLEGGYWIYHYSLNKFKDALEIKTMLARLIYDVFHYDRRYDVASIKFSGE